MQKEIIVSKKFTPTKDIPELTKRSYEFIDYMAETILSDPDFKREFFSEKGRISLDKPHPEIPQVSSVPVIEVPASSLVSAPTGNTHQNSPYADIKGIVLINGTVIKGQIISMDPDIVRIRTIDGEVSSYSFKRDVQRFIAE